ncbi:tRNA (adenosine(37)-N6)-dimethylallyltransferase MiaA [Dysgonomonas sp. 216]|uniref:tRNA (adenosine(37)-N6)-dimethylallyltransferase MiaA n=1 Tax=Dysgonomonas sp. 216 TaxID=2302934 RepID=UPI0013D2E411|nr:tRNA (adenosine(37)-N6)-dimethylallyltransferase MiaA [Dysgonomonas sp. 216]NDW18574.1 tRNA (adenosine(37)-N6)-dimethylallyltransferase MiaA [Dysgonomonas sp. 216]
MKKLIVLLGPTGVGKTDLSLHLAEYWNCPIISADSRQIYKGLTIGTAAPTEEQLKRAKHYLVAKLNVEEYYSASEFEQDSLTLINDINSPYIIMSGGSMMYIDAICKGIDDIPTIDDKLRAEVYQMYEEQGLEAIRTQLKILDPVFYKQVDLKNHKRVIHALEVCLMTGKPYSSLRTNSVKERPFEIVKIGLTRNRDELYERINKRVDIMMEQGLLDEARRFYPFKSLNSLNTVGYKELFKYLDNEWTLDYAIDKIKQSSRIYSRKQITWFKRDKDIHWINLSETSEEDAMSCILSIA